MRGKKYGNSDSLNTALCVQSSALLHTFIGDGIGIVSGDSLNSIRNYCPSLLTLDANQQYGGV